MGEAVTPMRMSIVIPSFVEPFLNQTIASLLAGGGDIEIIPVIDGYTPEEPVIADPRVKPLILKEHRGLREALNAGIGQATGDFLMKIDAHCAVAAGYDTALTAFPEDWLVIPRRHGMDLTAWTKSRRVFDYHYPIFPGTGDPHHGYCFQVTGFNKPGPEVDDTMIFQGSCWVANRRYFMDKIGLLDPALYGTFDLESAEIGFKYWLGGGAVKVNKAVWCAHLCKTKRHFQEGLFTTQSRRSRTQVRKNEESTRHWMNDQEPGMIHPFSWLVEKFWPIPTWPDDWRDVWMAWGAWN